MSLLDVEGVIIDGAIPNDVKESLVEKTKGAMEHLDMRGLSKIHVSPGLVGAKAQSIGSANLALQANYY